MPATWDQSSRQQVADLVEAAFARLTDDVEQLVETDATHPDTLLAVQQLDGRRIAWEQADKDVFFADQAAQLAYLRQLHAFAEHLEAILASRGVSSWDGFWDGFLGRVDELGGRVADAVPTPKDVLDASKWIVPSLVVLAALWLFGPELRALLRSK